MDPRCYLTAFITGIELVWFLQSPVLAHEVIAKNKTNMLFCTLVLRIKVDDLIDYRLLYVSIGLYVLLLNEILYFFFSVKVCSLLLMSIILHGEDNARLCFQTLNP